MTYFIAMEKGLDGLIFAVISNSFKFLSYDRSSHISIGFMTKKLCGRDKVGFTMASSK